MKINLLSAFLNFKGTLKYLFGCCSKRQTITIFHWKRDLIWKEISSETHIQYWILKTYNFAPNEYLNTQSRLSYLNEISIFKTTNRTLIFYYVLPIQTATEISILIYSFSHPCLLKIIQNYLFSGKKCDEMNK